MKTNERIFGLVAAVVFSSGVAAFSTVLAEGWVDDGCGGAATVSAEPPPAVDSQDGELDYVLYMEEEEESADGSVSVFW